MHNHFIIRKVICFSCTDLTAVLKKWNKNVDSTIVSVYYFAYWNSVCECAIINYIWASMQAMHPHELFEFERMNIEWCWINIIDSSHSWVINMKNFWFSKLNFKNECSKYLAKRVWGELEKQIQKFFHQFWKINKNWKMWIIFEWQNTYRF